MIALYEQKGSEYFEKHFTYTLLEYFGLSYDPIKILEREQYWKNAWIPSETDTTIIKDWRCTTVPDMKQIHDFAVKWCDKFRDQNINYIDLVDHFMADDCAALGFEMDCGHAFSENMDRQ